MIILMPIGAVDESYLEKLQRPLSDIFGENTRLNGRISLPEQSFNPARRQYVANDLLQILPEPSNHDRILAVVDVDIFTPGLNYVFGLADMVTRKGIISHYRLKPEFNRMPPDQRLLKERSLKEAVHELGHTYGLSHCSDLLCVMHFSNSLHETDIKRWHFCSRCETKLNLPKVEKAHETSKD